MAGGRTLGVVVVDDDYGARSLMRTLLELDDGFAVVGEATDGGEGADVCGAEQPDAVVCDVEMPRVDGISAIPLILEAAPEARIVMWASVPERENEALSAGAHAWTLKSDTWQSVRDRLLDVPLTTPPQGGDTA